MIPFLIAGLFVGTATIAPAQMSNESFVSTQTGSLAIAAAENSTPVSGSETSGSQAAAAQAYATGGETAIKTTTATPTQTTAAAAQAPKPAVGKTPSRPAPVPVARKVASRGGSSLSSSPAPTNQSKAAAVIATAKQYIGVKYLWGGTTPAGFDCSGFSQYVFAKHGISLPRVSRDQYKAGKAVDFANLQPGDLVFFALSGNEIDHLGIYIGGGQFINSSSSKGVTIYPLSSYWKSHFVGARRVL